MLRSVHKFQEGSETLRTLVEILKRCVGELQAAEEPWKNEFEALVTDLEYSLDQSIDRESGLSSHEFIRLTTVVTDIEWMILAARTWSDLEKQTLRKIVEVQRPELLGDLDTALRSGYTPKQVREIRDAVGDELAENGVTNGEINDWGIICEDFLARIGPLPP
jgi:hypothetical protein